MQQPNIKNKNTSSHFDIQEINRFTQAAESLKLEKLRTNEWWKMLETELNEKLDNAPQEQRQAISAAEQTLRRVIAIGKTMEGKPADLKLALKINNILVQSFSSSKIPTHIPGNLASTALLEAYLNHLIRYRHAYSGMKTYTKRVANKLAKKMGLINGNTILEDSENSITALNTMLDMRLSEELTPLKALQAAVQKNNEEMKGTIPQTVTDQFDALQQLHQAIQKSDATTLHYAHYLLAKDAFIQQLEGIEIIKTELLAYKSTPTIGWQKRVIREIASLSLSEFSAFKKKLDNTETKKAEVNAYRKNSFLFQFFGYRSKTLKKLESEWYELEASTMPTSGILSQLRDAVQEELKDIKGPPKNSMLSSLAYKHPALKKLKQELHDFEQIHKLMPTTKISASDETMRQACYNLRQQSLSSSRIAENEKYISKLVISALIKSMGNKWHTLGDQVQKEIRAYVEKTVQKVDAFESRMHPKPGEITQLASIIKEHLEKKYLCTSNKKPFLYTENTSVTNWLAGFFLNPNTLTLTTDKLVADITSSLSTEKTVAKR